MLYFATLINYFKKNRKNILYRNSIKRLSIFCILSLSLGLAFFTNLKYEDKNLVVDYITKPNLVISTGSAVNSPSIKGIRLFENEPFKIEFFFTSNLTQLSKKSQKATKKRLIEQFFTAVTTPEKELWINLSPNERYRIINDKLAGTEYGKDLLAEDYMLKQLSASLTHPKNKIGKEYWNLENQNQGELSKIWITPNKAKLLTSRNSAIIEDSSLQASCDNNSLAIESLLPHVNQALNNSKHFTHLRQLYDSTILAIWYKSKIRNSFYASIFSDKFMLSNLEHSNKIIKSQIYDLYLDSFKNGVYSTRIDKRTFFSGGIELDETSSSIELKKSDKTDLAEALIKQTVKLQFTKQNNKEKRLSPQAEYMAQKLDDLLGVDKASTISKWTKTLEEFQFLNNDYIREDFLVQSKQAELNFAKHKRINHADLNQLEQECNSLRAKANKKSQQIEQILEDTNKIHYLPNGMVVHNISVFDQIRQSDFMLIFKELNRNGGWKILHELSYKGILGDDTRRLLHYARRQFIIAVLREAYRRVYNTDNPPNNNDFVGIFGSDNWIMSDLDISGKGAGGNLIVSEYYSLIDELFNDDVYAEDLFDSNIYSGFIGLNKIIIDEETISSHTDILAKKEIIAAFTSVLMSVDKIVDEKPTSKAFGALIGRMHDSKDTGLSEHYIPVIEKARENYMNNKSIIREAVHNKKFRKEKHKEYLQKLCDFFRINKIRRDPDGYFHFKNVEVFENYLDLVIILKQLEIDAYHTPSAINAIVNNKQIANNNKNHPSYNDFVGELNYKQGVLIAALENLGKTIERSNPHGNQNESVAETFFHMLKYVDRINTVSELLSLNICSTPYLSFIQNILTTTRTVKEFENTLSKSNAVYMSRRLDKSELFIKIETASGFLTQKKISTLNEEKRYLDETEVHKKITQTVKKEVIESEIEEEIRNTKKLSLDKGQIFIKHLGSFNNFVDKSCELLNDYSADVLQKHTRTIKTNSAQSIIKLAEKINRDDSLSQFNKLRILKSLRRTLTSNPQSKHRRTNDGNNFRLSILNKQMVNISNSLVFNLMVELYGKEKGIFNAPKVGYLQNLILDEANAGNQDTGGVDLRAIMKKSSQQKIDPMIFPIESYDLDKIMNSDNFSFTIIPEENNSLSSV